MPPKSKSSPKRSEKGSALIAAKRAPAAAAKEGTSNLAETVVAGLLSSGIPVVGSLTDAVLRQYQDDAPGAIATIVSILCRASGIPRDVSSEVVSEEGTSAIASTLDDVLAHTTGASLSTYPLVSKEHKKLHKALPAFFERLTERAATEELFENHTFIETLFPWVSAMSESKARNFRHTATVAVYAMVTIFSQLIARLREAHSAGSAKSKAEQKRLEKRLEVYTTLHSQIFEPTLLHRCKDACFEIRLLSFQVLRRLMMSNPDLHVHNRFIRFLSVALFDKKGELRLEALDTLAQVLGTLPDHAGRLHEFLEFRAERIVELTADIETKVADMALKVGALLLKAEYDSNAPRPILDERRLDRMLVSVADDRRVMRTTAGTLLKMFIRCRCEPQEGTRGRAEMLCSFGATFLTSFREPWAARYIVDAVWGASGTPPATLTDYRHLVDIAKSSDDAVHAGTALSILAALMERCRGPLSLGPAAKDDCRVPPQAAAAANADKPKVDENALLASVTKDACSMIPELLAKYDNNEGVIAAAANVIAAVDLAQFDGSTIPASHLHDALASLSTSTLSATQEATLESLSAAWHHIVLSESTDRSREVQFQKLLVAIHKQAGEALDARQSRRGRSQQIGQQEAPFESPQCVAALRRLAMVASLANLTDHWPKWMNWVHQLQGHIQSSGLLLRPLSCAAAEALIRVVHHTGLWFVAANGEGAVPSNVLKNAFDDAMPRLADVASAESGGRTFALSVRTAALGTMLDFVALPFTVLSPNDQKKLIQTAVDIMEEHLDAVVDATTRLKSAVTAASTDIADFTASVTSARRGVSALEAAATRIATAVSRLFVFDRLENDGNLAPQWMLLWARVASTIKAAGEAFKSLFHALRDRTAHANPAAFEMTVLQEAARRCELLGANPSALDHLHQQGLKLSSMHFLPNDKYYSAVVAVVKFAAERAEAGDELMLHGVTPYCSRLRVADALAVTNSLAARAVFSAPVAEQSTFVRAFVTAVRRAAKLEAAFGGPAAADAAATPFRATSLAPTTAPRTARSVATPINGTTVRRRGTQLEVDDDDDILTEIVRNTRKMPRPLSSAAKRNAPMQPAADSTNEGWRGRGAVAVQARAVPSQQTQGSSMLGEDDVFVATQEWN